MPAAAEDVATLAREIKTWARELGFQQAGIAEPEI